MSANKMRLPAPQGLLIDRNRSVSFSFEGKAYQGFAGDTIASALLASGRVDDGWTRCQYAGAARWRT